jgi:hypothetical protein
MTDLERYALNDGGESSLNEGIEALVSDLERCQQDLATARENYTTARDNYRDSQCEIAAFYVTLATALDLPVETPAADLRALLWLALRERAALVELAAPGDPYYGNKIAEKVSAYGAMYDGCRVALKGDWVVAETVVEAVTRIRAERDELRMTLAATEARMAKARVEVVQTIECIQANNDNETPYWLYNWVRDLRDLLAANSE